MGNKPTSTKYKILEILRASKTKISGEKIAKQAGISRVSVWKAIQSLQEAGYEIISAKQGYFLQKDLDDSLFPWEFGTEENLFCHFPQTKSTMIEAKKIAEESTKNDTRIITSDIQTDGKGHDNHKWITTDGSLAYTIITNNKITISESHRITMVAQIALANILSKIENRKFYVRWPNDIWTEQGKVAGILDELSASGSFCKWINLGIGINLKNKPNLSFTDCVFKNNQTKSRKEILTLFLQEFKKQEKIINDKSSELSDEWNKLCFDLNKEVKLSTNKQNFIFKSINGFGWANILEPTTNEKLVIPPGKASFIKNNFYRSF